MTYHSDIYDKFCNGDHLADDEVIDGMNHFKALADLLNKSGSAFKLASNEANRTYMQLRSINNARKEN